MEKPRRNSVEAFKRQRPKRWDSISRWEEGAISILQFDATMYGGFTEARKLAALCELNHVQVGPRSRLRGLKPTNLPKVYSAWKSLTNLNET